MLNLVIGMAYWWPKISIAIGNVVKSYDGMAYWCVDTWIAIENVQMLSYKVTWIAISAIDNVHTSELLQFGIFTLQNYSN